jgi:serine protease AprX
MERIAQVVNSAGGRITSQLEIITGVAADLPLDAIAVLSKNPAITAITPNGPVYMVGLKPGSSRVPSTDYPELVGADLVWQQGVIGSGVGVAVVDSGLAWHPGLFLNEKGKPANRVVAWVDFVQGKALPQDPNGHGTHVAGIIANSEKDAEGQWGGVAPGVKLVGVRVLDKEGVGTYERVIQGIDWVVKNKERYNIRVMNLSIVSPAQSPYWADPINQAAMKAWKAGIVVVTAAGNGGPAPMTIGVPGNTPYVITVGAFTDNYTPDNWNDDSITPFSAAGPTLDAFVKPDVVAPGAHMVSSMLAHAYLARQHEANKLTAFYFSMAGTSQATAVVSGVAALILAKYPELTPDEVKFRLQASSLLWVNPDTTDALYSMWQQGFGRVNAVDAVFAEMTGAANLGMDITADLAGEVHYQGFTEYDEATHSFTLGGGYGSWAGGYGSWAGGYGSWAGGYGSWAGGYGSWAGGYGSWAGGYGSWAGSEPWAGSTIASQTFAEAFLAGASPNPNLTYTSTGAWIEEP